jgi:diadenosine tetraphosphatase ApaH/serine/threonine PP2A family protein phosphatase
MRILVISDIHANLNALEAVLEDAGSCDAVWCRGYLGGYGPDPEECVNQIRHLPNLVCLLGNHDAAVMGSLDQEAFNHEANLAVNWTRKQLSESSLEYLRKLNPRVETMGVTLSHGSPRNPIWEYLLDLNTVMTNFSFFSTNLCLVGHTHIPIMYIYNGNGTVEWSVPQSDAVTPISGRVILNPGSVGQPRDRDPRAAYAIFDPEDFTWQARRVTYDIDSVAQRIIAAGLPVRHATRLADGW